MDAKNNQSNLKNPHPADTQQKFKNKKFIFIGLGVIVVIFLAILSFAPPEKSLEVKISTTPPPATPTIRAPRVEDQVILKFKEGVTEEQIDEKLKQYNATIVKEVVELDLILVNVPKGQGDVMLDAFKKDNLIQRAQPNYIYKVATKDIAYPIQWGLKNTGQTIKGKKGTANADINVEVAWAVTKGKGVKIAILDSGIDVNHQDLSSKIVAQQDFTGQDIDDGNGHGTHAAGIAAAVADNGFGIAGTCPECELIIVKVADAKGETDTIKVSSGISWSVSQGAKVINMSLAGMGTDPTLQQTISDAWTKGAVIVAAAGNTNNDPTLTNPMYPAAYPNVVSVAATDNNDKLATFSHYGTWVTVAAPGEFIYSTLPKHAYALQIEDTSLQLSSDYLSGTSMAAPMVAGVAALILASNPDITNAEVVKILCDSADKITGTGTNWTCGRINAGKAVMARVPPINPVVSPIPSTLLPIVIPTWQCLGGNPCTSPMPSPVTSPGVPNQPPVLSGPVTSVQPTNINQPINPNPSINGPIINPPTNPNPESLKLFCYVILFLTELLGIDLKALGIDLGKTCGNI